MQAILELVHNLDPHWKVLSNVLTSKSKLNPPQIFVVLTDGIGLEVLENLEDSSFSQSQTSKESFPLIIYIIQILE